jgi:hypothetical protein
LLFNASPWVFYLWIMVNQTPLLRFIGGPLISFWFRVLKSAFEFLSIKIHIKVWRWSPCFIMV